MKIPTTIFLVLLLTGASAGGVKKARLITEGTVFAGLDGELTSTQEDRWFFEPASALTDDKGRVLQGARLELLPSAQLEKMTADARSRAAANYKLWGRVTKYKDRNFLFATYFLPLSKAKHSRPAKPQEPQRQIRPLINEPNDELSIPDEILNRLTTKRPARTGAAAGTKNHSLSQSKTDVILADRIGFLIEQPDGTSVFVPDALGRGIGKRSIRLLPCESLEHAEQIQAAELEQIRFKVAGVVTRYKGQDYLLLQRATRVYYYGNFGR